MTAWIVALPTWQLIRILGVASYLMLAIGICLGISYSFPHWKGPAKGSIYKWHTFFTNGGTLVGLLHGTFTVIDTYMPFNWSEVLIPFAAKHHPILNGLGTLAGYGLLLLIATSDIRHKLGKRIWLAIHLLSYPIFVMAFIHGFFLGTDSSSFGIRFMYMASMAAVLTLTAARGFARRAPRQTLISGGGKPR